MTDLESVGSIESRVPAWQLSSGRMSYFRGGPATDASGDQDGNTSRLRMISLGYKWINHYYWTVGGYLLMETSRGTTETFKLSSIMINATLPEGRCVVFQWVITLMN
jgi:hypothetical protein